MRIKNMKPSGYYLNLVNGWEDPFADPFIKTEKLSDGRKIHVVRDDILFGGSKIRFLDYLVQTAADRGIREIVYGGCPATGYAQMSLPILTKRYGIENILFMAKRNPENYTQYQINALELGANIHWVSNGMLTVTEARAREYCKEQPSKRMLLPLGLEHDTAFGCIIKIGRKLKCDPSEIWSIGSSGTINRGLQLAFPHLPVNAVQVGHKMSDRELGRAKLYKSPYPFNKEVKKNEAPPFPSAPTYDAKAWKFIKEYAKDNSLFWNVGK